MAKLFDQSLKRDLIKLACLTVVVLIFFAVFFVTPTLSTPMLLAVLFTMMFSPVLSLLEKQGLSRIASIAVVFVGIFVLLGGASLWATKTVAREWHAYKEKAPEYFYETVLRLQKIEASYRQEFPVLESFHPTESILNWGKDTGAWFITNGPKLMGDLLTWILIVPILTFFLMKDGRSMRKKVFELVPNRFFEASFMLSSRISEGLSSYLRAKIIEGSIVGILTALGLSLVGAPYALVLGVIAGVTNIVPYVGPVLGALPGLLIFFSDADYSVYFWPTLIVYVVVNVIDMALIFPVFVARIVNLHPLVLIAAVIVGQQYYGLIGMLISIPIATTLKVIFQEVYIFIYERPDFASHELGLIRGRD